MGRVAKDLTNMRFGYLKVLNRVEDKIIKNKKYPQWLCQCDCGKQCKVISSNLLNNKTKSCGCYFKEILLKINHDKFQENYYDLSGEYGIGYTNNTDSFGRNYFYFDLEDYDKIKNYHWRFNNFDVVISNKNKQILQLHRIIMNAKEGEVVDHIQHNKFDNRKKYLRIVTSAQNSWNRKLSSNNSSGVKGVSYNTYKNKWAAYISVNNQKIFLGSFKNKEDAIKIRKEAEEKYFGEYSYDNSMEIGAN